MGDGSSLPDDPIGDEAARELLRRQDALQAQAAAVLADLDLIDLLSPHGQVTLVGSAATGLMVQSDIDICVVPAAWSTDAAFLAARPLASHPRVQKLQFWNETGTFTPEGLAEGYYWGSTTSPPPARPGSWTSGSGAPAPPTSRTPRCCTARPPP